MASTLPYPSRSSAPPVLPSIHDLFREHIPRPLHETAPGRAFLPPQAQQYSVNHVHGPAPAYFLSTFVLEPAPLASENSSSGSSNGDGEEDLNEGKKHVCPACSKRFNRPSSLRTHANTHTGATPFHCPYPGCGRAFNVNSNMRRHFRSHAEASPFCVTSLHSDPSWTLPMDPASFHMPMTACTFHDASPFSPSPVPSSAYTTIPASSHKTPPTYPTYVADSLTLAPVSYWEPACPRSLSSSPP